MYEYEGGRTLTDFLDYVDVGYKNGTPTDVPASPSWFDEKMGEFRKNVYITDLMADFDEILSYRKNAAALLVALGVIIGLSWGFIIGNLFSNANRKVKKD